jgi:hypothetical protein
MARYEVCVRGRLSERARGAFCSLEVQAAPPQTLLCGVLPAHSDLHELLKLCSDMGLEVLSLQRLPG